MTIPLAPPAPQKPRIVYFASGFQGFKPRLQFSQSDSGAQVLDIFGMPVFRSGTFADSMGFVETYTSLHIQQMVQNYNALKESNIVPNMPVRKGHAALFGNRMDTVVGWHKSLQMQDHLSPVDKQMYTYLLADFQLFDDEAIQRVQNGDWPNRSAEVGEYITNDNASYDPCYMGFAYVDLPAVEGLNFGRQEVERKTVYLVDNPKELGVSAPNTGSAPAAPTTPTQPSGEHSAPGTPAAPGGPAAPGAPVAPAATPATPAAPTAPTGAPLGAPGGGGGGGSQLATFSVGGGNSASHVFTVGGKSEADYGKVQAHINNLEQTLKEGSETARKNFVSQLATENKILQPTVEGLQQFALSLTDEQYASWVKTYETAPVIPLLAAHGQPNASGSTVSAGGTSPDAAAQRKKDLQDIVKRHEIQGMAKADIEKTPSYQELQGILVNEAKTQ